MSKFLLLLWKKNDRNLKNIFWTHAIRTTTLPTLNFRPTQPKPKFYGPTPPTPPTSFFWPTPKFYRPTPLTPPTPRFDPRHPRTHVTHATHASSHPRYPCQSPTLFIYYLQVKFGIYVIWWSQFLWNDGLIWLFITRLGWSVKLTSIQDDQVWRMCVCFDISWEKPYSELIDSICVPSLSVMSWTNQFLDLALKSPSTIVKAGSLFLILRKRFSRDGKKYSNSP